MSVGGIIVDIVKVADDKWWIATIEPRTAVNGPTTAIYCDPEGNVLEVGDSLWWQAGKCFWTSHKQYMKRKDVPLRKIGYSGVPHPDKAKE